jgi:hypothetical protein
LDARGRKRKEKKENCIKRNYVILTLQQTLGGKCNKGRCGGRECITYGGIVIYYKFLDGNLEIYFKKNNMYCGLLAFFRLRLISILLKGLVPI